MTAFTAAMKSGWKECPEIPHAQTLSMMQMMDFIRRQLGISYEDIQISQIPNMIEGSAAAHPTVQDISAAAETAAVATEAAAEVTAGGQKIATNSAVAASNLALATTNTLAAGSGAASAVANIPYVGPILAIAALASVIGAIMAIPKFAKGGIAFGPTLGLFGEYAGAANNPEVVAPLDKLRDMLQPADPMGGSVTFRIEGRTLVGVLQKETDLKRRS